MSMREDGRRRVTSTTQILYAVLDLCVHVANGDEKIVDAWFNDDDLIVRTTDGKGYYDRIFGMDDVEDSDEYPWS